MNINETFGNNVRKFRDAKQWTQERLADEAGLHRTYISQVECGKRNPTLTVVQDIANALDVEPAALLAMGAET